MKKLFVPLAVAGALAVGGVSVGAAYAGTPAPVATAHSGDAAQGGGQHLRTWLRAHRRQIRRHGLTVSAKAIGVTPKALVAELRSGKSIADVAAQHNVGLQTVIGALTTAATAKVDAAVTDHKLSAAQAQAIESALPRYLAKAVNRVF